MRFTKASAAALVAAIPLAFAQTSTDCNPLEKTCPADTGLNSDSYLADFTKGSDAAASWTAADGTTVTYGSNGAEFTITTSGEAPTFQTDFYFLFGRVDVKARAAPGTGIVSSIVLESDDLDEIDWEWLGGDTTQVQTNFFGKGNTTSYDRGTYEQVSTPQDTFHTYSFDWTSERLEWLIDGVVVRTLLYTDALALEGKNYPQTPMRLKLGSWCGGCSSAEGTVTWAGGKTSFDDAPYIMYVSEVTIQNYNPASSYVYGDTSGSWQSIEIVGGSSSSNSSSSTSGSSAASSTASVVGSATVSISVAPTDTVAPTSMLSVIALSDKTGIAQSTTISGSSSYTPSASPSGTSNGTGNSTTVSSGSPSATPTNAAGRNAVLTGSGLLGSLALALVCL